MHITIYRGHDGEPSWATLAGVIGPDDPNIEAVKSFIETGNRVLAVDDGITVEVV